MTKSEIDGLPQLINHNLLVARKGRDPVMGVLIGVGTHSFKLIVERLPSGYDFNFEEVQTYISQGLASNYQLVA